MTAPVSDVFAGGATRLVPLFTGILTSAEPAVVSDGMETWSVEFRELAGAQPALGALQMCIRDSECAGTGGLAPG